MAGFLRKKNKDAPVKAIPSSPIPLGVAAQQQQPPAVPPLFARFATSNKSENGPLIVSAPKVLSRIVKKDLPQRASNRQPTPTSGAKKRSSTSASDSLLYQNPYTANQAPSKPVLHGANGWFTLSRCFIGRRNLRSRIPQHVSFFSSFIPLFLTSCCWYHS